MNHVAFNRRHPVNYIVLYAFVASVNGIYFTYLPVYLNQIGYTNTIVGTLLSVGPLVSVIAQPVWGIAGDRAKTKNSVLRMMIIGCSIVLLMLPITKNVYFLFIMIGCYAFFQSSIIPMIDTVILEGIQDTNWRYNIIRIAGTMGFAIMPIFAGFIYGYNKHAVFILASALLILPFFVTYSIKQVKGHQYSKDKVSISKLLKNRQLLIVVTLTFFINITLAYYINFFPIHYKQMGASNLMIGISVFLSSVAEIPFLLYSDKIIKKLGIRYVLLLAGLVMAVRWLLLYAVANVVLIAFINILHGFSNIVLLYGNVVFVDSEVPKELKATGQTMFVLFGSVIPRILGGIVGGSVSQIVGIRQGFLYCSIINMVVVAVFFMIFLKTTKRNHVTTE